MQLRRCVMKLCGVCSLMHCKSFTKGCQSCVEKTGEVKRISGGLPLAHPTSEEEGPAAPGHSWAHFLQDQVLFFGDTTWSPEWLFSLHSVTRHDSEWQKGWLIVWTFSSNRAMHCAHFSASLFGDDLWSPDVHLKDKMLSSHGLHISDPAVLWAVIYCVLHSDHVIAGL